MKYPLGIQTFSKVIKDNAVYVDKTAILYDLIAQGSAYFLSRPRRFGKSLLVSTLESLFSGDKALFKQLAIADTDYQFESFPVIIFEFSNVQVTCADDVKDYIINATNTYAEQFDIDLTIDSYEQRFGELVRKIHDKTGKAVVLLVDEYDKPILDNLFSADLSAIKSVINVFYSVVKLLDKHLRFVFITGVSKFAKVSVFSGMNSLTDISMDRRYATLCGVTQSELESYFEPAIAQLIAFEHCDKSTLLDKIKHWYNGYQFHHQALGVYNPYSLLSLFSRQEFRNYWFTTATPTFLIDMVERKSFDLTELTSLEIGISAFDASEPEDIDVLSLFVQTGYLTIKGFNEPLYLLDFPNYEVKRSFYDSVAARFGHVNTGMGQAYTVKLLQHLNNNDLEQFFIILRKFFANIPYDLHVDREKYYQSLFFAIFTLLGMSIDVEVRTNKGRIDCVLQTDLHIYVIEFKLNASKEVALNQIQTKNYAEKYLDSDKQVILVGVEFDSEARNIVDFVSLLY